MCCFQGWFSPTANSEMESKVQTANRGCSGDRPFFWRSRKEPGARPGHSSDESLSQPHGELGCWVAPGSLHVLSWGKETVLRRLTPSHWMLDAPRKGPRP